MKAKKISPIVLLFSILLSCAITVGNKIVFYGKVYENNFIKKDYSLIDTLLFITLIIISYITFHFLKRFYLKIYNFSLNNEPKNIFNFCFKTLIFLCFIFFLYFLTFYPGGIYVDTQTSINMISGKEPFTNHHPVLYTLCTYLLLLFEPLEISVAIFTILQILITIYVFIYFVYWLLKKGLNKYILTFIVLFLAFFKLYPLYSISLWKDTPFSLALFLYTITYIDLIIECNLKKVQNSTIINLNIFTLLVIFLRNNRNFYSIF